MLNIEKPNSTNPKQRNPSMIFQDKFMELNEKQICYYIMISFDDPSLPIFLYKKTEDSNCNEEKWEIYRKIINPNNQYCATMNFFYNEVNKKTLLYFGFSSSNIGIYDLKADKFEKTELETKARVTSLNFLFRKKHSTSSIFYFFIFFLTHFKGEGFLIYSDDSNTLIIANIETNKIVRKIALNNVSSILDCIIWNSFHNNSEPIYLIMATENSNSIQILNFDDLNVLFIKNFKKPPYNLLKVLKKKTGEKDKECLSCFLENADMSKIMIYERK